MRKGVGDSPSMRLWFNTPYNNDLVLNVSVDNGHNIAHPFCAANKTLDIDSALDWNAAGTTEMGRVPAYEPRGWPA